MESFTVFTSSAKVDHIILNYFPQQNFAKWLGMTYNCIWGTETAFEIQKHKNVFMSLVSFTGCYIKNEWKFPQEK